ncbi:hypothetical protein [Paraburkholderia sediminicola]|uniref:hypothetical protein n=1 Tax=Paraburkholderia sediminicola TaxID=458836 RepID=UPI0038BC81FE
MKNLQSDVPAWSDLLSGGNGWRALGLAGGVALHATNVYVATTILPSVVHDMLGAQHTALWLFATFALAPLLAAGLTRHKPRLTGEAS